MLEQIKLGDKTKLDRWSCVLNNEWFKITEDLNLKEGDVCVVSYTMYPHTLKVSIIENEENMPVKTKGKFCC